MPLKRLTWSKTRGTARECQPAARGCRPALHLAAAAAAAAALPCPALPTLAGQTPPHAQQQPGFTSASRRGRRGSRSPGPPSKAGGSQGRREGGRVPTRTCVSSSRLLPLPSGSSPAASAAPSAPPTQPLSPRPRLQRAWLIYARPAPRTRSRAQPRAAGHRLLPVPAPRPQPASAGGRLFLAQLRREVGHQRARSPRDCADCGAPGGAGVTGRANQQQTPRPCRTLLIANSNNCMRDLEQVISISRKGLRALLWNYQLNRA